MALTEIVPERIVWYTWLVVRHPKCRVWQRCALCSMGMYVTSSMISMISMICTISMISMIVYEYHVSNNTKLRLGGVMFMSSVRLLG